MNAKALLAILTLALLTIGAGAEPVATPPKTTQPAEVKMDAAHAAKANQLIAGGLKYLFAHEDKNGGWSLGGVNRPAVTAMVVRVLLRHPDYGIDHALVRRGLKVMLSYQQDNGGIYEPKLGMYNYHNSIAMMALSAAAKHDPKYKPALVRAIKYSRRLVIRPGETTPKGKVVKPDDPQRGGVSYGKHNRPDLSNAGIWIEAMHEAGVKADDPDMEAVAGFVGRMQNFSETNKRQIVADGPNDGGFFYALYESKGHDGPGGKGLRSYGSMTYAGFKSMLYAGVSKDDPRVRAAYTWIRRYWRLDSNPNMPKVQNQEGLYYYYHTFARALAAFGRPVIKDLKGNPHNWREELIDALAKRAGADGSWTNPKGRWEEGSPILVTCYALLALQETL